MRVLLVTMPFAAVDRPPLGLSLLKARLAECDIACDVAYPNLAFAASISLPVYRRIDAIPHQALAGEWVFSGGLDGVGPPLPGPRSYIDEILRSRYRVSDEDVEGALEARAAASPFLDSWIQSVDWSQYDACGFSSYCEQNLAALATARLLKERHPEIVVMMGGPNWHGIMGATQHRSFPFVDLAFLGEADHTLPEALHRLDSLDHGDLVTALSRADLSDLPGLAYRCGGECLVTSPARGVENLDALPLPDYSDYLDALAGCGLDGLRPMTEMETSRGCRWAERRPCLFCGLTGPTHAFRSKSPARILSEIRSLADRWQWPLDIVDNMVSPAFLDEVLPELAASPLPVPLFLEYRTVTDEESVRLMARAGASIQVGIESLDDHVLWCMNKGVRALENLRLLRWCKSYGVEIAWNFMVGIPGETDDDYRRLIGLVPGLRHLDPPFATGPVTLDRFSTYHADPERYGFRDVRLPPAYRYVYPLEDRELDDIAYAFDYESKPGLMRAALMERLRREVNEWRNDDHPGQLRLISDEPGGQWALVDSRDTVDESVVRDLDDLDALLYVACLDICGVEKLLTLAEERIGPRPDLDADIMRRLATFVASRLMATDGERYLSLAIPSVSADDPLGVETLG